MAIDEVARDPVELAGGDARFRPLEGRFLRAVNDLVDLALALGEVAVRGQSPRDIGGVAAVGAGDVHHHHVAVLHLAGVRLVVEHRGIKTRADDGRIRRPLTASPHVFVLHQRGDFVFTHPWLHRLHRRQMRFDRGVHGLSHQSDFARRLHRAHPRQSRPKVAKSCYRRQGLELRGGRLDEVVFAALRLWRRLRVDNRKRLQRLVQHGGEQRLTHDGRKAGLGLGLRVIGAELRPCPFFRAVIVGGNEKDFLVNFRRTSL